MAAAPDVGRVPALGTAGVRFGRMSVERTFPYDVRTVHRALTDPDVLVERNLALGELSAEYERVPEDDCTVIHAVRKVRRELPGMLAKFFDPVNVLDLRESWHPEGDGWKGRWVLSVRGQPVDIHGEFHLEPEPGGCRYRVSHRVRAKIPLISGQVEKYVMGQTVSGASDELEWLAGHLERARR